MKLSNLLIVALFGGFVAVTACNDKKEDPATQSSTESTVTPDMSTSAQDPSAAAAASPVSASTEFHFKCPKNCVGGGSTNKGNCPICGTELVHNAAFHNQAGAEGSSPQTPIKIDPVNGTSGNPTVTNGTATMGDPNAVPKQTTEPAQNAKGVWHWTCTKGCEGGGAGAGNCAKCGSPLAHNSAYHQQ